MSKIRPNHYQHPSGVECIVVARHHSFNIGNVLKYLWRAGRKDTEPVVDDLKKAAWYLNDEIAQISGEQRKEILEETLSPKSMRPLSSEVSEKRTRKDKIDIRSNTLQKEIEDEDFDSDVAEIQNNHWSRVDKEHKYTSEGSIDLIQMRLKEISELNVGRLSMLDFFKHDYEAKKLEDILLELTEGD